MEKIDLYNAYFHGIRPPCDEKGFTKNNELIIAKWGEIVAKTH